MARSKNPKAKVASDTTLKATTLRLPKQTQDIIEAASANMGLPTAYVLRRYLEKLVAKAGEQPFYEAFRPAA